MMKGKVAAWLVAAGAILGSMLVIRDLLFMLGSFSL